MNLQETSWHASTQPLASQRAFIKPNASGMSKFAENCSMLTVSHNNRVSSQTEKADKAVRCASELRWPLQIQTGLLL